MEKGGWLDQFLLGVLGLLEQPWLAAVVLGGGGFAIGYLARKSPKSDWEFLHEWPERVFSGAFLVHAGIKTVPHLVLPTTTFHCDHAIGPLGIAVSTDCRFVTEGTVHVVQDYTIANFFSDLFFASFIPDVLFAVVGYCAGIVVATIVLRRGRDTTSDSSVALRPKPPAQ